jgi:hypothetical protein
MCKRFAMGTQQCNPSVLLLLITCHCLLYKALGVAQKRFYGKLMLLAITQILRTRVYCKQPTNLHSLLTLHIKAELKQKDNCSWPSSDVPSG